jgi:CHAD domain-containing protein
LAKEVGSSLEAKRGGQAESAIKVLASASVQGALVVLARVIEEQSKPETAPAAEQRVESLVREGLKKREKQMRQAMGKAARKQTPESLHEARVAVKKLRYVSELAELAGMTTPAGGEMKRQVKALKRLQELLGDHHDAHVIVGTLETHLGDVREKPVRGLAAAWRKWRSGMQKQQARRAAMFLMRSYAWMNR